MILGAPDVVPHQDLANPAFAPPDDPDQFAYGDVPYACDAPYSTRPEDFVGPTRVVGRLPDLTGGSRPGLPRRPAGGRGGIQGAAPPGLRAVPRLHGVRLVGVHRPEPEQRVRVVQGHEEVPAGRPQVGGPAGPAVPLHQLPRGPGRLPLLRPEGLVLPDRPRRRPSSPARCGGDGRGRRVLLRGRAVRPGGGGEAIGICNAYLPAGRTGSSAVRPSPTARQRERGGRPDLPVLPPVDPGRGVARPGRGWRPGRSS